MSEEKVSGLLEQLLNLNADYGEDIYSMYPVNPKGGGTPISKILSAFQPLLGSLANMDPIRSDERLTRLIMGANKLTDRGAFGQSNNLANIVQRRELSGRVDWSLVS